MNDNPPQKSPEPASYEVGYKKPPKHTQFKKGQSGNPSGRPKGAKNTLVYSLPAERLKETFLKEAYRMVPTGAGEPDVPILQAVLRSLGVKAAKGNIGAQRLFAQMLMEIEAEERANAEAQISWLISYKQHWTDVLAEREKRGMPLDPPVPHPDQIMIDMQRGTIEIVGPLCEEEKEKLEFYTSVLHRLRSNRASHREKLQTEQDELKRKELQSRIDSCNIKIPLLEQIVGENSSEPQTLYEMAKATGLLRAFDNSEEG